MGVNSHKHCHACKHSPLVNHSFNQLIWTVFYKLYSLFMGRCRVNSLQGIHTTKCYETSRRYSH